MNTPDPLHAPHAVALVAEGILLASGRLLSVVIRAVDTDYASRAELLEALDLAKRIVLEPLLP